MRSNADGVPIQADGLPIGAGVCRGMSSGADTEVRPPATRVLGPLGALWGGARIGSFRSRFHGSPWDRFSFDPGPAERTQRSAPPRPGCWAPADGVFGWATGGRPLADPGLPAPQSIGFPSLPIRRADTEVGAPATRVLVPLAALCGWTGIGNFRSRRFERMRGARQAPLRSCPACGGGCGGACCSRHRGRRPPAGAPPPENQTPSPPAPECPPAARSRTRSASRICCR